MPGLRNVLTLNNGFIHLYTTDNVVRLDGQEFLQSIGGAISLQCPHLHLTEALTTELRLTTQGLLGNHRVRTGGTSVNLVIHQVVQLQDVLVTNRNRIRERLTGTAVNQTCLTGTV